MTPKNGGLYISSDVKPWSCLEPLGLANIIGSYTYISPLQWRVQLPFKRHCANSEKDITLAEEKIFLS